MKVIKCYEEMGVKASTVFIIATLLGIILSIIISATTYFCVDDISITRNQFHITSETEEFVFESSFGIHRCRQKGTEEHTTIVDTYNKEAGNIDNWGDGINLNEYNLYSESINIVNGNIINTEVQDTYMLNTYSNGKVLKVLFHNTDNIIDYSLEKGDSTNYIEQINIYGDIEYIYDSNYVEVIKEVKATEDVIVAYEFDTASFFKDMGILILFFYGVVLIAGIGTDFLIRKRETEREKQKETKEGDNK